MEPQKFVEAYNNAWNRQRPEAILALMHSGATYFDAFWMEYCSGRDLERYLADTFDEEDYFYRHIGTVLTFDKGVVFRYGAHEVTGREPGPEVYRGAEVLHVRDGQILTVSDFYCIPTDDALLEVANLTTRRHGLTRYAKAGLGASTASKFRKRLAQILDRDHACLDPDLTVAELADRIGCSVGQLAEVISSEFGMNFDDLIDKTRARYAKELLHGRVADAQLIEAVARKAGFRSVEQMKSSFFAAFGMTPEEFCRRRPDSSP